MTAQTEFPDTKQCVEKYLAPLLKASGIRWVQIARAAQSVSEGFRVLSDTRSAEICYTGGQYRLRQELEAAGTVPEYAHGKRKCSIKSKGDPLDAWIAQELGEQPFRHFLGFNAEEENESRGIFPIQALSANPNIRSWIGPGLESKHKSICREFFTLSGPKVVVLFARFLRARRNCSVGIVSSRAKPRRLLCWNMFRWL